MLTKKQVHEIREHLECSQQPLFFFDNDPDGLCSFLILQRYLGRGKGVPIRSFPELSEEYFRKVHELNADYIFILDKPIVSDSFLKKAEEHNIPIVWIDHHSLGDFYIPDYVNYYNPLFNKTKSQEPVTAICYQISRKKDDLWLAVAGSIADSFIPDFYKDFIKKYPDLAINKKNPFDIFYKSEIGRMARIFSFALKDRTTNVVKMMKFLMQVKNPYEVLEENAKNRTMHQRYGQINSKYTLLIEKAVKNLGEKDKLLFFQYGGDLSISSDLANELSYMFPKKIIVTVYVKGVKANISMRGKNAKNIFLEAIKGIDNARGGGHDEAVGGQMKTGDLEKFRENLEELITN